MVPFARLQADRTWRLVGAATMAPDYRRHGTTTLVATLDVKSGLVIGECQPRHRTTDFLRFLRRIDRTVKKGVNRTQPRPLQNIDFPLLETGVA